MKKSFKALYKEGYCERAYKRAFTTKYSQGGKVLGVSKSGYYYAHKKVDDSELTAALSKNDEERPQEGFWLSYHRIRLQCNEWNHKRLFKVYQSMGLSLRRKKKK